MSRAYFAQSPAHSVTGAYPNAPNQWTNYGVQPQTWPATTQGQHWPAGYTQPASYGAYTGYGGNYANPQLPAPVPQSTAYGAYPPAYPAQALPQQNYAQPAASQSQTLQQILKLLEHARTSQLENKQELNLEHIKESNWRMKHFLLEHLQNPLFSFSFTLLSLC